ncbi:MAG TPA: FKBP-type peptidyl-prolyl cis-trans isomerase [Pasteurellaceae bacterium]|nr:FKBP-type peptidyl-prolyl cis-trans isomerase [Pasteurellaceae bacterium]
MKFQKLSTVALMLGIAISGSVLADTAVDKKFTDDASYAVGALLGTDLKGLVEAQKEVIAYDNTRLLAGVTDALNGKVDLASNKELVDTLKAIDEKLKAASQAKAAEQVKKAKEDGAKLAAEFKKKDGVKETKSGLLYRIEKEGSGAAIKETDMVKVHYTGKLPDGTVFDSSRERNKPVEFALNQVIPGWIEGLQLIKKGGKIELVIPADLAYGEQGMSAIPPNSTLYFDVEVLDAKPVDKK